MLLSVHKAIGQDLMHSAGISAAFPRDLASTACSPTEQHPPILPLHPSLLWALIVPEWLHMRLELCAVL